MVYGVEFETFSIYRGLYVTNQFNHTKVSFAITKIAAFGMHQNITPDE